MCGNSPGIIGFDPSKSAHLVDLPSGTPVRGNWTFHHLVRWPDTSRAPGGYSSQPLWIPGAYSHDIVCVRIIHQSSIDLTESLNINSPWKSSTIHSSVSIIGSTSNQYLPVTSIKRGFSFTMDWTIPFHPSFRRPGSSAVAHSQCQAGSTEPWNIMEPWSIMGTLEPWVQTL